MAERRSARPRRTPGSSSAAPDARAVAANALDAVLSEGRFLDAALSAAGIDRLEPRDRAFAQALLRTACRRLGEIDQLIDARLAKPLPATARLARRALQLGVAELIGLNAPAYAVVDAAVRQAKRRAPKFAGLVNAVLRRIAEAPAAPADQAARLNAPDWFFARLAADWGAETAAAIAAAHAQEPPLDLTPRAAEASAALVERLGATPTPTGSLRLTGAGAVTALPGYEEGAWWVQDAAAAAPARLALSRAVEGARILDLCAAPGGKTLQLAAAGAEVAAVDLSERRMARLDENLARTGLDAERIVADALVWRPTQPVDGVVLDAPCSASGTVRRHPELPWIRSGEDVASLVALQARLLDAAWEMLRPGGALVYCACSLFKAEGEDQAVAFLARTSDAAADPISTTEIAALGLEGLVDADGWLRTTPAAWPEIGGMDGFFAARLRKTG